MLFCQFTPSLEYLQPATLFNVTDVVVLDASVGADGVSYSLYTESLTVSLYPPDFVVTEISVYPGATAVRTPVVASILATSGLEEVYVIVLSVALAGETVAGKLHETASPIVIDFSEG